MALLRHYYGFVNALLRHFRALLKLYEGSVKAVLRSEHLSMLTYAHYICASTLRATATREF
jgi:hypothetical protein